MYDYLVPILGCGDSSLALHGSNCCAPEIICSRQHIRYGFYRLGGYLGYDSDSWALLYKLRFQAKSMYNPVNATSTSIELNHG